MVLLEELQKNTEAAVEKAKADGAKIVAERMELVKAYRTMGLEFGAEAQLYDERIAVAERLGFRPLSVADAVEAMTGEKQDEVSEHGERQSWSWFYDHREDKLDSGWGGRPAAYTKYQMSAFSEKKVKWRLVFGKPNCLRRKIPPGVVLAMNSLADLRLFNCFSVLAPEHMWVDQPSSEPDPIMFATIAHIGKKPDHPGLFFLNTTHFFLARWDHAK